VPHVVPLPHDGTDTPDDHGGDTHGVDDHSSIQAALAGEYIVSPNMGIRYRARPVMTHHGVLEVAGDLTALGNASAAD
jgi:hypothetical protein